MEQYILVKFKKDGEGRFTSEIDVEIKTKWFNKG